MVCHGLKKLEHVVNYLKSFTFFSLPFLSTQKLKIHVLVKKWLAQQETIPVEGYSSKCVKWFTQQKLMKIHNCFLAY